MNKPTEQAPNDGSSLNHYLGNDEYEGCNLPDQDKRAEERLDGKEALGNELPKEEDEIRGPRKN